MAVIYGIEVRRVGRQEKHLGSGVGDQGQSRVTFVGREIVHDDDVARPESGDEPLAHIGVKALRVRGSFQGHASRRAIQPDGRHHGRGLPMPVGGAGPDSLALGRTSAPTSEVGFGARFIQKNQLGRVQARLPLAPETTSPRDVGAVLCAGAECLFLYVNPIFPSTTWMA